MAAATDDITLSTFRSDMSNAVGGLRSTRRLTGAAQIIRRASAMMIGRRMMTLIDFAASPAGISATFFLMEMPTPISAEAGPRRASWRGRASMAKTALARIAEAALRFFSAMRANAMRYAISRCDGWAELKMLRTRCAYAIAQEERVRTPRA